MKRWLEKHFGFSQKEIQGVCFLLLVIGILYISPSIYAFLFPVEVYEISEKDKQEIQAFLTHTQINSNKSKSITSIPKEKIKYFEFNPNELSIQQGTKLGLSMYQIRMIQNYLAKGGHFYKKEDFRKIYSVDENDYERLSPYIKIPARNDKTIYPQREVIRNRDTSKSQIRKSIEKLYIELNSADSLMLQKLYGIGPVFASRIVRFRDNLGGFYDKLQLMDVYGMDNERYELIKDHVFVNLELVKKININDADIQTINRHLLIDYKQANAIVQYRKQHGDYEKPEDLLEIVIIDDVFLRKIAPYLSFSQ